MIRVALYNQMFGLDGRSFLRNVFGHIKVHYRRDAREVQESNLLAETVRLIRECGADIAAVCEILEGQEEPLVALSKRAGYSYACFAEGHRTSHSNLAVKVGLLSKFPFRRLVCNTFPVENVMGGGGGLLKAYFDDSRFCVLIVHMASARKAELYKEQMRTLVSEVPDTKRVLLLGDFNLSYRELKSGFPGFTNSFALCSQQVKTCSVTPLLSLFVNKDVDHIFGKGVTAREIGTCVAFSDHKLVFTDIEFL